MDSNQTDCLFNLNVILAACKEVVTNSDISHKSCCHFISKGILAKCAVCLLYTITIHAGSAVSQFPLNLLSEYS